MDLKNPTRTESLLANIAGYTGVPVPDMKNATRTERLLKEILDNGGGGGGDVTKEYVDNAISNAVADIDDDISALSDTVADKVDKVNGKSLSTNDYTDADKVLVQNSPITVTSTTSPISTANGKPRKLAIYGKSEVVDGEIVSAGEGYAVVDLGTLIWARSEAGVFSTDITNMKPATSGEERIQGLYCTKYQPSPNGTGWDNLENKHFQKVSRRFGIKDLDYTNATAFKAAMSGVLLCYQLADPSQGNTIAVKTDNGTGIDGTMATFTTGTPLRGIPEGAKDTAVWDGSTGEVVTNCVNVDLSTSEVTWNLQETYDNRKLYYTYLGATVNYSANYLPEGNFTRYNSAADLTEPYRTATSMNFKVLYVTIPVDSDISIMDGVHFLMTHATPTITPLTQAENESIASLRTYSPQTAITINGNPEFEVEAYANTANGQMISDMQPTRSPLLTLSASGWTNNAQTVTYEHNTGKRNSIDVEPANIKAWTAAGILATAETASTITFECDTVPTADLSFRVTSMEVR